MRPHFLSLLFLPALALALFLISPPAVSPDSALDTLSSGDGICARDGAEYVGVKGCKKCHFKQWSSWKKTGMAESFDSLKPGTKADEKKKAELDPEKDYTKDAKCLACHTTGYGKPGGYPALVADKPWTDEEKERAAALEGVQCESCHGPGSLYAPYKDEHEDYKRPDIMKLGLIHPDAESCKTCHNTDNPTAPKDFKFDYEAMTKDEAKIHKHSKLKEH